MVTRHSSVCLLCLILLPLVSPKRHASVLPARLLSTVAEVHHFLCDFAPHLARQSAVTLTKRTRSDTKGSEVSSEAGDTMTSSENVPLPLSANILITLHRQRQQQRLADVTQQDLQELNKRLLDTNKLAIGLDLQTLSVRIPAYRRHLYQDQLKEAKDRLNSLG